jgi:prepilin-type N-terminal cleavage/methylation domain-containing protein
LNSQKRAFTLIELLVVIAIIAILAAILFPVFAQAKAAAKDTSNLSNTKQMGLSILMYSTDYDDYFPLSQRYEPANLALFQLATWQTECQPYIKNWGIFQHPKNSAIPQAPAAMKAWHQNLHYGVMNRAGITTQGATYFQAFASGFTNGVTGGQLVRYEGFFGEGCQDSTSTCPWTSGRTASNPSMTQTQIENISGSIMAAEGSMWDLWTGTLNGINHPLAYGVYWYPCEYSVMGCNYTMAGPHARKNPIDGRSGMTFAICNGLSTHVRTDGSAKATPYRGQLMKVALVAGQPVLQNLWPAGGF